MNLINLLTILNQLKVFHWQTRSYAEHQAFGMTYDNLNELIDEFVEVYFGKYGRVFSLNNNLNISLNNYSSENITPVMDKIIKFLTEDLLNPDEFPPETNSDLLNIRDEMLSSINKLNYLLTLTK